MFKIFATITGILFIVSVILLAVGQDVVTLVAICAGLFVFAIAIMYGLTPETRK